MDICACGLQYRVSKKLCLITVTRDLSKQEANACILTDVNIKYVLFYSKIHLFFYKNTKQKMSLFGMRAHSSRNKALKNWDHTFFSMLFI